MYSYGCCVFHSVLWQAQLFYILVSGMVSVKEYHLRVRDLGLGAMGREKRFSVST